MAKKPNQILKDTKMDLLQQKRQSERHLERLKEKAEHIKEEISKLKDWIRLGIKAEQCSVEIAKRLFAPEIKKIAQLEKELKMYTSSIAKNQKILNRMSRVSKAIEKTEVYSFKASLLTSSEVKNLIEKCQDLKEEDRPSAQAEAKILAHILNSARGIKDSHDVNGMAKTIALIEQGESLLSKKSGFSFFEPGSSNGIQSAKELKELKAYLKEQIENSMESNYSMRARR